MVIKQKLTSAVPPKGVESLPRPLVAQLKYEDHASCQNKSGSTIKVFFGPLRRFTAKTLREVPF